jgi:uncharacterized protein YllA (UPF0747 family)
MDIPAPLHVARATATLIEKRFDDLMAEHEINFDELTGDIEQVINRVLAKSFPADLEAKFNELKRDIESHFEKFRADSLRFDPNLDRFAEQIHGKIDYNLNQFEQKVFNSHKKKSQQTRDRIYKLHHALQTNRGLQERSLNICYLISRYGFGIVDFIREQLDSEETAHQLISIGEMTD